MSLGQIVYHSNGGYYRVNEKPSSTQVTLANLGYPGNPTPGTTVTNTGATISPAGKIGPAPETIADTFTLTADDITAQQVTLSTAPANVNALFVMVRDGPVLIADTDYTTVTGTPPALSWQDKELASTLSAGDVLVVRYSKLYTY